MRSDGFKPVDTPTGARPGVHQFLIGFYLNDESDPREQLEPTAFIPSKSFDNVEINASTHTKGVPCVYEFKFKLNGVLNLPTNGTDPGFIYIAFPYDSAGKTGFNTDLNQTLLNGHVATNGSKIDCPPGLSNGANGGGGSLSCTIIMGQDKVYVKLEGYTTNADATVFHFYLLLGNPAPDTNSYEVNIELFGYHVNYATSDFTLK
jgi:hypothetical protein